MPSSARSTPNARAPLRSVTPRLRNSSSRAAATSGSLFGSTCWRLTISVTSEPNDENMCTNSTPVTPDPDPGAAAGADQDGVSRQGLGAVGGLDDDLVRAGQPAGAAEQPDALIVQ